MKVIKESSGADDLVLFIKDKLSKKFFGGFYSKSGKKRFDAISNIDLSIGLKNIIVEVIDYGFSIEIPLRSIRSWKSASNRLDLKADDESTFTFTW